VEHVVRRLRRRHRGLTGLIFIVVAFRFDTIAISEEYRSRAAQALPLFLTVTAFAVLFMVPQYGQALGAEFVLVAVLAGALLRGLDKTARRGQTTRPSAALAVALFAFTGCLGGSGLVLALGQESGAGICS